MEKTVKGTEGNEATKLPHYMNGNWVSKSFVPFKKKKTFYKKYNVKKYLHQRTFKRASNLAGVF